MNAMLEARMVPIRIHTLADGPHGNSPSADRITASSQGTLIEAMDAIPGKCGSEVQRSWANRWVAANKRRHAWPTLNTGFARRLVTHLKVPSISTMFFEIERRIEELCRLAA